jgi:hypothetical protein
LSNELLKLRRNKIYKARSLVVAIAISCLPIASAIAQQTPALVGEWNGTVENWAGNDLRKLIVAPDGSCRWGYPDTPGGPGAAKSCSVNQSAGTIDLVTSADSIVNLKLNAGNLEGSLQLSKNGLSYPVTLAHGPRQVLQDYKWRARAILESGPSNCGQTFTWDITLKDRVLKATGEANNVWTLALRSLKSDGSGQIQAKSGNGHQFVFTFDAGQGPRAIRQTSVDTGCRWVWSPS